MMAERARSSVFLLRPAQPTASVTRLGPPGHIRSERRPRLLTMTQADLAQLSFSLPIVELAVTASKAAPGRR